MENKKHTFAICAYKESEHLEACIKSVLSQTYKSEVYISTSTPNEYISSIAKKYHLRVYDTNHPSDIQDDWNSAYGHAKTALVTVAHQDDIYAEDYAQSIITEYEKNPNASMYFCDYKPIKDGIVGKRDINCLLKYILRQPLRIKIFAKSKFFKVMSLSFGNSISCPSVTYNRNIIKGKVFTSKLKFALDWDTFLKFAKKEAPFIYINKVLIYYRVYEGATTKKFIVDNTRQIEDTAMFSKIWPKFIVKILMKVYVKSYKTYD